MGATYCSATALIVGFTDTFFPIIRTGFLTCALRVIESGSFVRRLCIMHWQGAGPSKSFAVNISNIFFTFICIFQKYKFHLNLMKTILIHRWVRPAAKVSIRFSFFQVYVWLDDGRPHLLRPSFGEWLPGNRNSQSIQSTSHVIRMTLT